MRKWIGAGMLAAVAVGAVACGGAASDVEATRDGAPATGAALAAAATQTADAGTGRVEVTMRFGGGLSDVGPGAVELTGEGAYDTQAQRSSMALTLDGVLGMLGESDDATTGGAGVETVTDGDVVYVRAPMLGALLDDGDRWIRLDPTEVAAEATERGIDPSLLDDVDSLASPMPVLDPAALLDWLTSAGAEVTVVGSERVNGVDTTHQRATLELGDFAAQLDAGARAELERSMTQLGGTADSLLATPLPVDVYVDGDGFVRRLVLTVDYAGGTTSGSAGALGGGFDELLGDLSMTITVDYLDLGEPVDIAVPEAADTIGVAELLDELPVPTFGTTTTGG